MGAPLIVEVVGILVLYAFSLQISTEGQAQQLRGAT